MKKSILICTLTMCLTACSSGGNINNFPTQSIAHTHDYKTNVVSPTCTKDGYTLHKCSCGDQYIEIITSALGHAYVEREQNYKCSRCGRYEDEGFSFEAKTVKGVQVYEITKCLSSSMENGVVTTPRKHLGCEVVSLNKGCLYPIRESIQSLKIKNNITYVGSNLVNDDGSFWKCNSDTDISLESVYFDKSCKNVSISHTAFYNCLKLSIIEFDSKSFVELNYDDNVGNHYLFEDTPFYKSKIFLNDGMCYIDSLLLESYKDKLNSSVVIKNGTTLISNYVFSKNTNIKTVTIPPSVVYIGNCAFEKCKNLLKVIFLGTEEEFKKIKIESSAFSQCNDIEYIYS